MADIVKKKANGKRKTGLSFQTNFWSDDEIPKKQTSRIKIRNKAKLCDNLQPSSSNNGESGVSLEESMCPDQCDTSVVESFEQRTMLNATAIMGIFYSIFCNKNCFNKIIFTYLCK